MSDWTRSKRQLTQEEKDAIVREVLDGQTTLSVSNKHGQLRETVQRWVRDYKARLGIRDDEKV